MPLKYQYYAANVAVLWLSLLFYRTNRYYLQFLSPLAQNILLWLGVAYTVLGGLYVARADRPAPSHAYRALAALWRWLAHAARYLAGPPAPPKTPVSPCSAEERASLLFLLVKFIYLPMMLQFLIGNWYSFMDKTSFLSEIGTFSKVEAFNSVIFPFLMDLIFLVECGLYAFGYAVEGAFFKNLVKSVEPTFLGWAVALACYPPFNGFVNNYVSWYTNESPDFPNEWVTFFARAGVLVCFIVYLWAALSLGTKCSNLTNRGIVVGGAFRWVRHPAYASKNLGWWIALLPGLSVAGVLSMLFWSLIYFLRAITEERHLASDPAYAEYCRKVRYRFVPGVY